VDLIADATYRPRLSRATIIPPSVPVREIRVRSHAWAEVPAELSAWLPQTIFGIERHMDRSQRPSALSEEVRAEFLAQGNATLPQLIVPMICAEDGRG